MKEKLMEYYKDKISLEALVYKKIKWNAFFINFTTIGAIIFVFCMPFISHFKYSDIFFISMLFFFALTGLSYGLFARAAKKIITNEYKIEVIRDEWNNREFKNKQELLLTRYLISNGLFSKRKIELLIHSLKEDVNNIKYFPPFIQTILVSVFVTGITKSITALFKIEINNIIAIILVCSAMLLILGIMIAIIVNTLGEFKEFFFKKVYYKKALINHLEDILLMRFD